MRRVLVKVNQIVAGTLTETDDMRYIFQYDAAYLIDARQHAISLAFPKRSEAYVSDELFPFFSICFRRVQIRQSNAAQCKLMRMIHSDCCWLWQDMILLEQ